MSVEPTGHAAQDPLKLYKENFNKSLDLFQDALKNYQTADEIHKKAKLKDVMDKALDVLNQSSSKVLKERAKQIEEKLAHDYQTYISDESPETYNQLTADISSLRNASK